MFLSHIHHPDSNGYSLFKRIWSTINLMVGNSKRFNCRTKQYKNKITLSIMTIYMLMFTIGLFAGDLIASHVINLEKLFGMFSTAVVYSLGFSILQQSWKHTISGYASLVALVLIGSQTAMVFNLFPVPVQNIFYYFASIIMMVFTYTLVHKERYTTHGE